MSLINEALKRTRDSAYQAAQTSPPVAAGYRLENGLKARDSKTIVRVMGASAAAVFVSVIVLVVWLLPRIESVKDVLKPAAGLSTPPSPAPAAMAATPKAGGALTSEAEGHDRQRRETTEIPRRVPSFDGIPPEGGTRDDNRTEASVSRPAVGAEGQPSTQTPAIPKSEVAPSTQAPAAAPVSDAKQAEDQIVARVMERIKAAQPAAPGTPQLMLQGITYAPDDRDAMINGVTVHEGDVIEGARVVTIESRRVTLNFNGQEIILRLP